MKNGSETLLPGEWQKVPGRNDFAIFPYIRKVDTVSSNTYLLDLPEYLIIIDPGGLPEQIDAVLTRIDETAPDKPVIILLTHVHIDHCLQALFHPVLRDRSSILAVHEKGAAALDMKDTDITQAKLFSQELCDIHAGIRFFGKIELPAGIFSLLDRSKPLPSRDNLIWQSLEIRDGEIARIYPTPGHSPDSICIQVGNLLFTGDLLFAANPGVAGLCGWSQSDLISSVQKVLWLLENGGITICCPGHGRIVSAGQAIEILHRMEKDAAELTGIEEVNPEWAKETALYAEDLMAQVCVIFTVIAGRLFLVSHIMDELEEAGESERIRSLAGADAIDMLIEDFSRFTDEYRAGRKFDIHLALKAGQIAQKLDDTFGREELGSILDPSLIRRAERLLTDYMTVFRGFRIEPVTTILDLRAVIRNLLLSVEVGPVTEQDLVELSDDEEAYLKALVARLAFVPLLNGVRLVWNGEQDAPLITACPERLPDLIQAILEELVGNEVTEIVLETSHQEGYLDLFISGRGEFSPMAKRKERLFSKECLFSGGSFEFTDGPSRQCFRLRFPLARPS